MQRLSAFLLTAMALGFGLPVVAQQVPALMQDFCSGCHNTEDWAGGLAFETLDYEHVNPDAESWEKVVRKLRAGMMPPPGEERPAASQVEGFVQTLEARLDTARTGMAPDTSLHRLNRNEYGNVIRDLLALDLDVAALLPQDNASEGFDNVASGLGYSPALVQGYTSAAMKIAQWAIGDMSTPEQAVIFNAPPNLRQDRHIEGMPLGTRGGLKVRYNFPLDAEYEFIIRAGFRFRRDTSDAVTLITLDGEQIKPADTRRFRMPMTAGEHELTISILDYKRSVGVNDIYSEYGVSGGFTGMEIHGPYAATGTGTTASRNAVFSCYPVREDEEATCAREIMTALATRAFRQPVNETELEPLLAFYRRGYAEGGFEAGIQQGLARILIDPRFLFRFELEPDDIAAGATYAISDLELASRLSFFLWSSIPDAQLQELAVKGELHQPAILRQQVQRMLHDPRSKALVTNFAGQWLHLRQLQTLTPDNADFNDNLRQAFINETSLMFANMIENDLPVTDLLDASYTFLNETLAEHYGIAGIHGDYFRKVALAEESPRRGILGQASFLTVTSTATRTSPVIRGNWILENLLHAPVPAPPPGVETNIDGDGTETLTTSVRERLEAHRSNPGCNACHGVIDPVGFSLENFDMIGAWRTMDGESEVDTTGTLVDGTPVSGAPDLRNALMARKDLYVSTMTEKMLIYALGRKLEYYDMPAVRAIVREAAQQDYRFSAIVNALVTNEVFLTRAANGNSVASGKEPLAMAQPDSRGE